MDWIEVRRAADLTSSRWRNGAGETVELFVGGAPGHPDWRFSVARIEGIADYSDFSGLQRIQVLLDGGPLQLHHAGAQWAQLQAPAERLRFAGDLPLRAFPQSACRVGNGFVRAPEWQMEVWLRPLLGTMMLPATANRLWLGQLLNGQLRARCAGESVLLKRDDAFLLNAEAKPWAVLEGSGSLLLAQVERQSDAADQFSIE